jgi:hypothetical protein
MNDKLPAQSQPTPAKASAEAATTPAAASGGSAKAPPAPAIPADVLEKIKHAYGLDEEDWRAVLPFFESRVAELKPDRASLYLKALEIAVCDKDLLEYAAHHGRIPRLARELAIREIVKPGFMEVGIGARSYRTLSSMGKPEEHAVYATIDGEAMSLTIDNNPENEAVLEAAALAKLEQLKLSDKGVLTKAFELKLEPLEKIQRQMALIQARRDQLLDSYLRESALSADRRAA